MVFSSLPTAQARLINPHELRQFLLGQSIRPADGLETGSKVSGRDVGAVADELDNGGNVADFRLSVTQFPVGDATLGHAHNRPGLRLRQSPFESSVPYPVT